MARARIGCIAAVLACLTPLTARAADVQADPTSYQALLTTLKPGDTLRLAAGDYTAGMNLFDLHGDAQHPIVISGPATGAAAVLLGKSGKNTIDIRDASYLVIENLVLDGQGISGIDAIKAGGQATNWAHHITIQNCTITGHDGGGTSQQTVGISTKIVAWDWVVRGNLIDGAGTGAYFGNSDGTRAFIGGVIEGNLFRDTLGYNMQIKQQNDRQQADVPQVPTDPRVTVIRHNVFLKSDNPSPDGARPNLLVDGPPDTGPGSQDRVEIYGNLFVHNDDDALFQGNGRLHIHDNVFVDSLNPAIRLTNHAGKTVIEALVYNNTIYDVATGVQFSSAPSGPSLVAGNAIFSPNPLSGTLPSQADNVSDAVANAGNYVVMPSKLLGQMDFYPKSGSALSGSAIDLSSASGDQDYDRDFNGTQKSFAYRGAYSGQGTNPGWQLADDHKPLGSSGGASGAAGAPSGGAASGGSAGLAGGGAANGGAANGGAGNGGAGNGGAAGLAGGASGGAASGDSGEGGGCGCRSSRTPTGSAWLWAALGALVALRRRR